MDDFGWDSSSDGALENVPDAGWSSSDESSADALSDDAQLPPRARGRGRGKGGRPISERTRMKRALAKVTVAAAGRV